MGVSPTVRSAVLTRSLSLMSRPGSGSVVQLRSQYVTVAEA